MALLEKHFDIAFDALGGVEKLRELILTLAMLGKLVPQDSAEQPASELLKEIETKKLQLAKKKEVKKSISATRIKAEEAPYKLPDGWEWVRLEQIMAKIGSGSTPRGGKSAYVIDGIPFLRSQNIWNDGLRMNDVAFISRETHAKMAGTKVMPMDILLNITGASLGRCTLVPDDFGEANVSQHVTILRNINTDIRRYLHFLMLSPYCQNKIWTQQVGMSREGLSKKVLELFEIPIPPLDEQRRIVAKIDQLMARCDELEKLRVERDRKKITVHTAALNRLLTAPDNDTFTKSWQFITQHFSELYAVKENVVELRKAILQLAVMGKLAPQKSNNPQVGELLKEIEAQKQKLIKQKKIKQSESLREVMPQEKPFELPKSWQWVRLGDIVLSADSGWSPQCLREPRAGDEWGVLKVSAVSWGNFNPDENKALPRDKDPRPECEVKVGDFLLSRANTEELVARSVVVTQTPHKLMMSDKLVRLTFSDRVDKFFVNIANGTYYARAYYISNASGTSSSMKNISRDTISRLPIPLPPLEEQRRIVAKVNQLMSLCDSLEQKIEESTSRQAALLNVVMTKI
jgi:type I restriction enzyme, S subunit